MLDFGLDGRVALITGAGRGIGLGVAKALAEHGAAVAIQDLDREVAEAEAERLRAAGHCTIALGGDISDTALAGDLVAAAMSQLGGLHIVINNAAIQSSIHWTHQPLEEIERIVRADFIFPILLCRLAVPIFRSQRWGRIINVGSIQQLQGGSPHMLPYAMSKGALVTMTRVTARDLAKDNVTVNMIAPGYFDTWRNRADFPDDQTRREKGKWIPLGRIGQPSDCAGAAVLLCSPAGDYITGQTIYIDGGMSAR